MTTVEVTKVRLRPAALVVLLLVGAVSCGPGRDDCVEACERPYRIAESTAEVRSKTWARMPTPQREQAAAAYDAWRQEATAAREAYVESCLPGCLETATRRSVRCRRQAKTLMEWNGCSPSVL